MMLSQKMRGYAELSIPSPLLLCILVALFVSAYQPKEPSTLDLDGPINDKFLDRFYPAENGAR